MLRSPLPSRSRHQASRLGFGGVRVVESRFYLITSGCLSRAICVSPILTLYGFTLYNRGGVPKIVTQPDQRISDRSIPLLMPARGPAVLWRVTVRDREGRRQPPRRQPPSASLVVRDLEAGRLGREALQRGEGGAEARRGREATWLGLGLGSGSGLGLGLG